MNFCSHCGHHLIAASVDAGSTECQVCASCGRVCYDNPKLLVWCFAYCEQRLLMCRRAIEPARGLWNPPAGFVEKGETLEEAAARETFEEAGIRIPPSDMVLYRVASIPHMNEIYIGFRAELSAEPVLRPGPEVLEARFWSSEEFPVEQLAFRDMLKGVPEDFFDSLKRGQFPVVAQTIR